jgi:hypothetical protein
MYNERIMLQAVSLSASAFCCCYLANPLCVMEVPSSFAESALDPDEQSLDLFESAVGILCWVYWFWCYTVPVVVLLGPLTVGPLFTWCVWARIADDAFVHKIMVCSLCDSFRSIVYCSGHIYVSMDRWYEFIFLLDDCVRSSVQISLLSW